MCRLRPGRRRSPPTCSGELLHPWLGFGPAQAGDVPGAFLGLGVQHLDDVVGVILLFSGGGALGLGVQNAGLDRMFYAKVPVLPE